MRDGLVVLSDGGGGSMAFRASDVLLVEADGGATLVWLRGMDVEGSGLAVGVPADEVIRWWARALGMEAVTAAGGSRDGGVEGEDGGAGGEAEGGGGGGPGGG